MRRAYRFISDGAQSPRQGPLVFPNTYRIRESSERNCGASSSSLLSTVIFQVIHVGSSPSSSCSGAVAFGFQWGSYSEGTATDSWVSLIQLNAVRRAGTWLAAGSGAKQNEIPV